MITTVEALLAERLADLREDEPGNVRGQVDHSLGCAWDALWERQNEGADKITTALGHVDAALAALTASRARLAALEERDGQERLEAWAQAMASHKVA